MDVQLTDEELNERRKRCPLQGPALVSEGEESMIAAISEDPTSFKKELREERVRETCMMLAFYEVREDVQSGVLG
ncbi:hypothetical protein Tco_1302120 [Tanacetum coccineum]